MFQEADTILRKSLHEVDRIRKHQMITVVVLVFLLAGLLVWLGHVGANPATDVRTMIVSAVIVLFVAMVYVAVVLAMVYSKMTLRVLKAIELLSRQ